MVGSSACVAASAGATNGRLGPTSASRRATRVSSARLGRSAPRGGGRGTDRDGCTGAGSPSVNGRARPARAARGAVRSVATGSMRVGTRRGGFGCGSGTGPGGASRMARASAEGSARRDPACPGRQARHRPGGGLVPARADAGRASTPDLCQHRYLLPDPERPSQDGRSAAAGGVCPGDHGQAGRQRPGRSSGGQHAGPGGTPDRQGSGSGLHRRHHPQLATGAACPGQGIALSPLLGSDHSLDGQPHRGSESRGRRPGPDR